MHTDNVIGTLTGLKRKGEITGYGYNYKATNIDGIIKPELMELGKVPLNTSKASKYVENILAGDGGERQTSQEIPII